MAMKKLGTFCAAALALGVALVPSIARASDPLDNTPPWFSTPGVMWVGDASIVTGTLNGTVGIGNPIPFPTGDVDWVVFTCGGVPGALGTVKSVRINFTHAQGDIDMEVRKLDSTFIGRSTSTANFEFLDVSALNAGAVAVKVYGFNGVGNAGGWKPQIGCQ
jgi:hypothetical protein